MGDVEIPGWNYHNTVMGNTHHRNQTQHIMSESEDSGGGALLAVIGLGIAGAIATAYVGFMAALVGGIVVYVIIAMLATSVRGK